MHAHKVNAHLCYSNSCWFGLITRTRVTRVGKSKIFFVTWKTAKNVDMINRPDTQLWTHHRDNETTACMRG